MLKSSLSLHHPTSIERQSLQFFLVRIQLEEKQIFASDCHYWKRNTPADGMHAQNNQHPQRKVHNRHEDLAGVSKIMKSNEIKS